MTAVTLQSESNFMNVGSQNEMVEILYDKNETKFGAKIKKHRCSLRNFQ